MKKQFLMLAIDSSCCFMAAQASAMTSDEYKVSKEKIEADYKVDKAKCDTLKDNAKDVCQKEASGKEKVAKAELEQQYKPSDSHARKVQEEKVEVSETTTKVDVNPENNAGAIVMTGKDLESLSDDPDELQSELQALAGPSAGPNGGQIYIDGFTAGQLPPKASIREIRINQNPFSAEYDKLGYGRIEVLTKPGTDQFHGQLFLTGNTAGFN